MQCIGCGATLSRDREAYCASCRALAEGARPLPPASHPVASGAAEVVVCSYCGERNRLAPGRVRLRCGKCNTPLPPVGSSATGPAPKPSPMPPLPPRDWAEPRPLEASATGPATKPAPKRILPAPDRARPRSGEGRTTSPWTARRATDGVVWLGVTLALQAALAAALPRLAALVRGAESDLFFVHGASFWSVCAVPTALSILGWLAAAHRFPSLERRWALFVPAWLSWVTLITAVTSRLAGEGASAGALARGLVLAVVALLPRILLRRLGLGSLASRE